MQANDMIERGVRHAVEAPATKAEIWLSVLHLVDEFRHEIEQQRGWENLWVSGEERRDERAVQVSFNTIVRPLARQLGIAMQREVETGRGPVDFEFGNGVAARVHVEFKLADHHHLMHGIEHQLPAYMRAENADSALFICVGFDDEDRRAFERVVAGAQTMQRENPDIFLRAEYIDAQRRSGASRH